jgi:hypothetical protein
MARRIASRVSRVAGSATPAGLPGGSYVKAQPREHGAGTDAEGRFSCPVFRLLSASVLSAFGAPRIARTRMAARRRPYPPKDAKELGR